MATISQPSHTSSVNQDSLSCIQKLNESKWTDFVLAIAAVACGVIGILASTGVFSFIGTTTAIHLSYGMYGAAAFLMIIEIAKLACKGTKTSVEGDKFVEKDKFAQFRIHIKKVCEKMNLSQYKNWPKNPNETVCEKCEFIMNDSCFMEDPIEYMELWAQLRIKKGSEGELEDIIYALLQEEVLKFFGRA